MDYKMDFNASLDFRVEIPKQHEGLDNIATETLSYEVGTSLGSSLTNKTQTGITLTGYNDGIPIPTTTGQAKANCYYIKNVGTENLTVIFSGTYTLGPNESIIAPDAFMSATSSSTTNFEYLGK